MFTIRGKGLTHAPNPNHKHPMLFILEKGLVAWLYAFLGGCPQRKKPARWLHRDPFKGGKGYDSGGK